MSETLSQEEVCSWFLKDCNEAIRKCEFLLFSPNFQDFESYFSSFCNSQPCSICTCSVNDGLVASCFDCQATSNSMVCLSCFIAGEHYKHHSIVQHGSGTCDCGDSFFWKKSGNCPHHQGDVKNPELEYLEESERKKYQAIFDGALNALLKVDQGIITIEKWINKFIAGGDALRRLISISICNLDFEEFKSFILRLNEKEATFNTEILNRIASDQYARTHMPAIMLKLFPACLEKVSKSCITKGDEKENELIHGVSHFLMSVFHYIRNDDSINSVLEYNPEIAKNALFAYFDIISNIFSNDSNIREDDKLLHQINSFTYFFKLLKSTAKYNTLTNQIVMKLMNTLNTLESSFTFTIKFNEEHEEDNTKIYSAYRASIYFPKVVNSIANKEIDIRSVFQYYSSLLMEDNPDEETSIFTPGTKVKLCPLLAYSFWRFLMKYGEEIPEKVEALCIESNINSDDFFMKSSIYIIRLFALFQNFFEIDNQIFGPSKWFFKIHLDKPFLFYNKLFVILQIIMCLIKDKERFFRCICFCFGIINKQGELSFDYSLEFLHFIGSLMIDRTLCTNKTLKYERNLMISKLEQHDCTIRDLSFGLKGNLNDEHLGDELISIAERILTKHGSIFKLKDDNGFHFFQPWLLKPYLTQAIAKNPRKIMQFPITEEFINGLKIPSFSGIISSYALSVLLSTSNPSSITLSEAIIILFFKLSNIKQINKGLLDSCDKLDFEYLSTHINKNNFCNFKINGENVVDIVLRDEVNGAFVLERCDIGYQPQKQNEEHKRETRQRLRTMKEKILEEYKLKQQQYISLGSSESIEINESNIDNTGNLICPVCNESTNQDNFGYPCFILFSNLSKIIQKNIDKIEYDINLPEDTTLDLSICKHPIHFQCRSLYEYFQCPICNGYRNSILPNIPSTFDITNINTTIIEQVNSFAEQITMFLLSLEEHHSVLWHLINMITNRIELTEFRYREQPDALDDPILSILFSNLIKTTYIYFQKNLNGEFDKEEYTDDISILIMESIKSSNIKQSYKENVKRIGSQMESYKLYEFLRRSAILLHFGFEEDITNQDNKFIDWDILLSMEHLLSIFELTNNKINCDIDLNSFNTPQLADKFIANFQPPYNYDIFDCTNDKYLDLITGKILELPEINEYFHINRSPKLYILLSGKQSTTVVIFFSTLVSSLFYKMFSAYDSFYVDRYGDPDPNFKLGLLTYFSKDRFFNILDKFMNNNFIENIKNILKF